MGKMEGSIFVSGLKTGDAEAWRYLFVCYYAVYLRFITKIVGDVTSAEDIAQEVICAGGRVQNRGQNYAFGGGRTAPERTQENA